MMMASWLRRPFSGFCLTTRGKEQEGIDHDTQETWRLQGIDLGQRESCIEVGSSQICKISFQVRMIGVTWIMYGLSYLLFKEPSPRRDTSQL